MFRDDTPHRREPRHTLAMCTRVSKLADDTEADPATAGIPIIVVSMVDERARGLALGAFDYLVKPVGRESLLAALRALPAA